MLTKLAILLFAGACLAYPADDEQRPLQLAVDSSVPQGIPPPQPQGVPPSGAVPVPAPQDFQPEGQIQGGPVPPNPEKDDLKTDNTYWYRRSYYPVYYRRSYYPRSYSYSYYTPYYYSYWW